MNALILGFGAIARALCTLNLPIKSLIIIDKIDLAPLINDFFNNAVNSKHISVIKFAHIEITKANYIELANIMDNYDIDIFIDCSYNVDTLNLLKILSPGVSYINTSTEDWGEDNIDCHRTLKERQDEINDWYHTVKPKNNILLDCGMNPGLISLWAYDCSVKFNFDRNEVTQCIVSEVDTQRAKIPRVEGEFLTTWSPDGFLEEVHSPVEGYSLGQYYTNNKATAYRTISKSIRPTGKSNGSESLPFSNLPVLGQGKPFYGHTVRHAETITMHKLFPNATLMYIYKAPDEAIASLFEYQTPTEIIKKRIMTTEDIIDGRDELGVLMSDGKRLVWYGSLLSNDDVKTYPLAEFISATSYQVACGLWTGIHALQYYQEQNIYNLMTPEDIIECPLFEDLLSKTSQYLKMHVVEFEPSNDVNEFIKNKSFVEHFVNINQCN